MFILWTLVIALSAMAHTSNKSDSGQELFWPSTSLNLRVGSNSKSLTNTQVQNILQNSLNQWNPASTAKIQINGASRNSLTFTQNSDIFGSGVVGVTQITYGTSGAITQADIILNERNYTFTTNPSDTLGATVYLGDVLTHELGHFVGLSHSEVLESTMFYSAFRGQATLAEDDRSGVRAKYDGSPQIIQGRVAGGKNVGVFGANVIAFSAIDGTVEASTITEESGAFVLTGLRPDRTYYLYVTRLKSGGNISFEYRSVQSNFCPGAFVGSFFQGCSEHDQGLPQPIHLSYGEIEDVGTISIKCSTSVPVEYFSNKVATPKKNYDVFASNSGSSTHQQAMMGVVMSSEVPLGTYQKVDEVIADYRDLSLSGLSSPFLKVGLNVTQIGSPLDMYFIVTRTDGAKTYVPVEPQYFYVQNLTNPDNIPLSDPASLMPIFDFSKNVPLSSNTANNRFKIEIYARKMRSLDQMMTFPGTAEFLTTKDWPYLLTMSIGSMVGFSEGYLIEDRSSSDNQSCLDAPFTYSVKKSQVSATTASSKEENGSASCGTITPPPSNNGQGGMMVTMFLGFMLTAIASIISKSRKYFLS
jgi:hypothetical protein